jgi:hypothetical protein
MDSAAPSHTISTSNDNMYLARRPDNTQRLRGQLDEVRFTKGLLFDELLLGKVAADYQPGTTAATSSGMDTSAACAEWTRFTAPMGNFSDHGSSAELHDSEYANSINCSWLIDHSALNPTADGSTPRSFIALTFSRFSTEPAVDVVEIYDGNSTNAPLLGAFSGYDVPPYAPLVSTGTQMLVRFVTDGKQTGQQLGWHAKFVSIALSAPLCASVNEGHRMNLSCPNGYKIQKVQFASYGTPQGYCSNSVAGIAPNSNPHGASDGATAGDGAGGDDGVVLFNTGYCHANRSKEIVQSACVGQTSCSLAVSDAVFGGGQDPCANMNDTVRGSGGTDDPAAVGSDAYPRFDRPYQGGANGTSTPSKRLFVQLLCEGSSSFAANCFNECEERHKCLYGMTQPYCNWCPASVRSGAQYGLSPTADGGYVGEGCGSAYCVKEASCKPAVKPANCVGANCDDWRFDGTFCSAKDTCTTGHFCSFESTNGDEGKCMDCTGHNMCYNTGLTASGAESCMTNCDRL